MRTHLQKLAQLLARLAVLASLLFMTVGRPGSHASPPSPPERPSPASQLPPGSLSPTPTRVRALLPVILRNTDASSEMKCHSLTLFVSGGMGAAPDADDPNCAGGLYRQGSVVALIARPSPASRVYRWHGTDDDTSTSTINCVTITSDKRVSVHYIHEGDPSTPVGWGSEGGVAAVQGAPHLEAVIGSDDRVQITNTTAPPWRWNAKLEVCFPSACGGCTGWFVGPHTVATAGHCVYNASYGGWAISIRVIPAKNGFSEPYGSQYCSNLWSVGGWVNSALDEYDYGALILPNDTLGNLVGWYGYGYSAMISYPPSPLRP